MFNNTCKRVSDNITINELVMIGFTIMAAETTKRAWSSKTYSIPPRYPTNLDIKKF